MGMGGMDRTMQEQKFTNLPSTKSHIYDDNVKDDQIERMRREVEKRAKYRKHKEDIEGTKKKQEIAR